MNTLRRTGRPTAWRLLVVGGTAVATLAAGLAATGPATASPGQNVVSLRDLEAEDLAATLAGRGVTVR
ncbi:MAG: hypothetical protein ACRDXB_00765, partial [Actinomycetes bacterium]